MSKAIALVERLTSLQTLLSESMLMGGPTVTYVFKGFPSSGGGFGAGSTASTKNVRDHLRAKNLIVGQDYEWVSPLTLDILQSRVDRDLLDSIQSSGGFERA